MHGYSFRFCYSNSNICVRLIYKKGEAKGFEWDCVTVVRKPDKGMPVD